MSGSALLSWYEEHSRAVAVAVYALVAAAACAAAYFALFSQFASWDDEGTVLVSIKGFANGSVLYRDVYSPYGPFFYELFGGFFKLSGLPVSTDASRLIVLVVWVASSLLFGVSVQRLSGRLLLGVGAMLVSFSALRVLISEPMHPQGLCALLLAVVTLLVVCGPPRRAKAAGAGLGALLAALLLTKVNLGALALAAFAFAAVLTIEPLYRWRLLRWPVVVAFLAMPAVLMSRELDADWTRDLIALELAGTLSLLAAARPWAGGRWSEEEGAGRWLIGAALGFAAVFVLILVVLFATGPSPADLYEGAVGQGVRIGDVYIHPLTTPGPALIAAPIALLAALAASWARGRPGERRPSPWPGLLRAAAGLAIWLAVSRATPLSLDLSGEDPLAVPLVLAWVAVLAPSGEEPPYRRFARVFLVALALAETLQVYPVAGSQVGIASVAFVAVGGICIADGIAAARAWAESRGPVSSSRLATATAVGLLLLVAGFAVQSVLKPGRVDRRTYRAEAPLSLPHASLLHLPPEEVDTYRKLVGLLHSHRCTSFSGYPNIDSLYLWSGIEPPPPSAPGAWVVVLDSGEQQRVVDEMRRSPRPCAFRNEERANNWLLGAPRPDTPLANYIYDEFRPVALVGGFEFMIPSGSRR